MLSRGDRRQWRVPREPLGEGLVQPPGTGPGGRWPMFVLMVLTVLEFLKAEAMAEAAE